MKNILGEAWYNQRWRCVRRVLVRSSQQRRAELQGHGQAVRHPQGGRGGEGMVVVPGRA